MATFSARAALASKHESRAPPCTRSWASLLRQPAGSEERSSVPSKTSEMTAARAGAASESVEFCYVIHVVYLSASILALNCAGSRRQACRQERSESSSTRAWPAAFKPVHHITALRIPILRYRGDVARWSFESWPCVSRHACRSSFAPGVAHLTTSSCRV